LFEIIKIIIPHILFGTFFFNFINDSFVSIFLYLELSIIIFILIMNINKYSCYPAIKYFFIQTISSIIFIASFIFIFINIFILLISIFVKRGLWPFHIWLINLCNTTSWITIFYLITFQKFLPIYIIFSFNNLRMIHNLLFFVLIINLITGWLNCYTITDARIFFGYNSITDQSWLFFAIISREHLAYAYIFTYTIFSYLIFINLDKYQTKRIRHFGCDNVCSINLSLNIVSIIGLPPRLGFFLKFIIVYYYIYKSILLSSLLFIFIKIIRIFFFSRPIITAINVWEKNIYNNVFNSVTNMSIVNLLLNVFGLFVVIILY